jgi:hypothetical protein
VGGLTIVIGRLETANLSNCTFQMTDRNKPGVAFWATVVVAYPVSFGPWMCLLNMFTSWVGDAPLHAPLGWHQERSAGMLISITEVA